MKLENDPEVIAILAEQREDENLRFRTFLKGLDIEVEELDAIVHKIYKEVSAQINCEECRNCCKKLSPELSLDDIKSMASVFNLTEEEFQSKYLKQGEDESTFFFRDQPCPMLEGNQCKVNDCRPADCRSFPHLHKSDFVFRLLGVVCNCSICPIVFHVYERLKAELWQGQGKIKIKAAFVTAEDEPPDLILSFAELGYSPADCKSLILVRTKEYEKFKCENERGVSISWEDDTEEDFYEEIITSFEWNKTQAIITSPKRTFEIDLKDVRDEGFKEMEQILFKMNQDNCFLLKSI
ncbi:MAG: YkgJ family cysteine cluster protein [Kiritimatiellae bacterium]|jgi:Fe-S-cluster containining protein|nr:YkgJ family cysteine cluster protein [Kiritimatiellia bacterium]